MPSPFPGMDPYLEGWLWSDVHQALANKIRQQLAPRLRPHYAARLEISVIEDQPSADEIHVMYPDVEIIQAERARSRTIHDAAPAIVAPVPTHPLPMVAPLMLPVIKTRVIAVEIRDVANNQLIAVIELLSPINKREPHLTKYRAKRTGLHRGGVHLLEIDLLRRGTRALTYPQIRDATYVITLTRAIADQIEVWPLRLPTPLPVVPVPLCDPDLDVPLDLGAALRDIYDEAAYDLSIDYNQSPPPPPLSLEEAAWLDTVRPSFRLPTP